MSSVAIPAGDHDDRGPELVAVTWVFTALATVVVGTKIFTRVKIIKEPALDDFFTILSLVLILTCTSVITASVDAGMGRHAYHLTVAQRVQATKLNFIANPFGIMAYSLPNISVAIFIHRILRLPRTQKWVLYSVTIAQNIIAGISCVLLFTQCSPTEFLWNPTIPAKCLSSTVLTGYSYFVGAYSAFTDILLAIIPIFAFWKLQMKLRTKIGVCLLMGTTALAAICAIVKTSKLNELADLEDFTYGTVDLLIWAVVEADVIIIAACIPALRPFAISVTLSMREIGSRSRPKRRGYQAHTSGTPLALKPMDPGELRDQSNGHTDDTRSDQSLTPSHGVKQTTNIVLEWE